MIDTMLVVVSFLRAARLQIGQHAITTMGRIKTLQN